MPPEASTADASQWLRRAQSSLLLAKQDRPEGVDWADLCYLAQQAADVAAAHLSSTILREWTYPPARS